jgi:hypothetical protein
VLVLVAYAPALLSHRLPEHDRHGIPRLRVPLVPRPRQTEAGREVYIVAHHAATAMIPPESELTTSLPPGSSGHSRRAFTPTNYLAIAHRSSWRVVSAPLAVTQTGRLLYGVASARQVD